MKILLAATLLLASCASPSYFVFCWHRGNEMRRCVWVEQFNNRTLAILNADKWETLMDAWECDLTDQSGIALRTVLTKPKWKSAL